MKMGVPASTHFRKTGFFQNCVLTVFTAIALLISGKANSWLNRHGGRTREIPVDSAKSASFRWHPTLFRILSVGQYPAAVDFLLLRFLTDDILAKIKDDEETELYRVLDLATEIDPAFLPFYTAGSNFLSIVRNDRRGALKLLTKGEHFLESGLNRYPENFKAEHWPLRWRINFNLGYLYLYEFDDFDRAMTSYEKMGRYPDLPEALQLRVERVKTPEGRLRFAIMSTQALKQMNAENPRVVEELETRRVRLLEQYRTLAPTNTGIEKAPGDR